MVATIAERASDAVALLDVELPTVPAEIPRVDFSEAQQMIEMATGEKVLGEPDLAPAHERWLGEWALAEHGSDFLFVEGYPMVKRPFYTQPNPEHPEFSNSFDLLFRGLELVTGGQRLHRYSDYVEALDESTLAALDGYLQAFRYGMPPHGGFAIGLERWVSRIVGAPNVRQVTLFPRDINRLTP
jgi:nondiscriminating aspartyl-tRNA synthetase